MRTAHLVILGLALLGAGGCELLTAPAGGDHLGLLSGFDQDDPGITVPATVTAGEPFTVLVRTYGPSGCWSRGRTEVTRSAGAALVVPFDRHSGAEVCTDVLMVFEHTAELTFDEPGAREVVVRGREGGSRAIVTFSRTVEVVE